MKRNWTEAEMNSHFNLSFDEFEILANKSGPTRLGFAVLLKFFQLEGRFPSAKNEVPRNLVNYLVSQVDVAVEAYLQYDWLGRSIKYHRAQIRQFLGFRPTSVEDQEQMLRWMAEKLVRDEQRPEILKTAAYQRWREAKIEPPTPEQLQRIIRSVLHTYEETCFTAIYHKLSETTRKLLENLLNLPDATEQEVREDEEDKEEISPVDTVGQKKPKSKSDMMQPTNPFSFQQLKQAPSGSTLKAVLKEITRLEQLRCLPIYLVNLRLGR